MSIPLKKGEKVLWTSMTGKNYRRFVLVQDLVLILAVCIGIYLLLGKITSVENAFKPVLILFLILCIYPVYHQVQFYLVRYTVTTDKIVIKKGIFNREFKTVNLKNIIDTEVKQNFLERTLSTGNLYFYTANDSQTEESLATPAFHSIDNPFKIYGIISEAMEMMNKKNNTVEEQDI